MLVENLTSPCIIEPELLTLLLRQALTPLDTLLQLR